MPGGKFQDTVELIIAARDQATATVEKVRKKVREANQGQEQFGGKLVQNALRATSAFGSLELGLGGVNAVTSALSGSWEDAADAVERLPAGIGPFARQLKEVLSTTLGIRQEIERAERAAKNAATAGEGIIGSVRGQRAQREAIAGTNAELRRQIELLNTPPDERRMAVFRQSNLAGVESARKVLEALRADATKLNPAIAALNEQLDQMADEIETLYASPQANSGAFPFVQKQADAIEAEMEVIRLQIRGLTRVQNQGQAEAIAGAEERLRLELELAAARNRERIREAAADAAEARRKRDDEAAELRHEQQMLVARERRAAINATFERGLLARIEELEADRPASRQGIINAGPQEVTGRFQGGIRDQLSQQRDAPMVAAAREAARQRDSQIRALQDAVEAIGRIEDQLRRPGTNLLPARLRIGRGF